MSIFDYIDMTFPESYKDREKYILNEIIDNNNYHFDLSKIETKYHDHTGVFYVFSQPLKINDTIINCSARTMQQIADFLGFSLLTEKMANLIWMESDFQLEPCIRQITSSTQAMIQHSDRIAKQLEGYNTSGKLIANGGKHWIIGNKASNTKAINYGWFVKTNTNLWKGIRVYPPASNLTPFGAGGTLKVIQPASTAHDASHVDYSQTCTLMAQTCLINGQERNIYDVLTDPVLSYLISHEGPLKDVRQPGVKQEYYGSFILGNLDSK